MATRLITTTELVSDSAVQFIRPVTIRLTLTAARPNTRMFVFFDGVDLTQFSYHPGNPMGSVIQTDTAGQAVVDVNIPGGRFAPGDKEIIITDTNDLANLDTVGSVFGYAKTSFSSRGRVQVFQESVTRVTTVTNTQTVVYDPLAQSFFTYGNRGGIFVSSIDIFFQTKDEQIPVRVDIRPLINGYPSDPWNILKTAGVEAVSVKTPDEVNISSDGSVPTKFEFDPPVYLEEDKDYCFVVFSVSPNYNIFTSRMGERSFENGRTIFEQPFIGSMFKSENNITWEASQFEDIKFVINRAQFDTSSIGELVYAVDVPPVSVQLSQFTTTSGSRLIRFRHNQDHGLEIGDKIGVAFDVNGSYNGIPGTALTGTFDVAGIIDRNTVEFFASGSTNALTSGQITSSNTVSLIQIDNGGTNYSPDDTVTIGGPGSGAEAELVVSNGRIVAVNVTNPGTGYVSAPLVTINSVTGSGAVLVAIVDQPVVVRLNKAFQGFIPSMNVNSYGQSRTESFIRAVSKNFEGGNLVSYLPSENFRFNESQDWNDISANLMVASRENEVAILSDTPSCTVTTNLISESDNVSPVVNLRDVPRLKVYSRLINDQPGEDLTSNNSSGTVSNIVITSGGSAYTVAPIVTISPPNLEGGVQATATATISGGVVNGISVTNPGSGYTRTPLVVISRGVGDTTGSGAAAQVVLTPFNTELLPSGGNARAKYLTKRNTLATISNGIRVYATISSQLGASVDWYVRTSLSSSNTEHETLGWRRLNCLVERNKSSSAGEFLDYEFFLDNMADFDTYDLKCVMLAQDPTLAPIISSYSVIVVI